MVDVDMIASALYCGMADDILTLLAVCDDVYNYYAIDWSDRANAQDNTRKSLINDIVKTMSSGNDAESHHAAIMRNYGKYKPFCIEDPITVTHVHDSHDRFSIHFKWKGLYRRFVYFCPMNFIGQWPVMISEVKVLMSVGAVFPACRHAPTNRCSLDHPSDDLEVFWKMIKTRTMENFTYISNDKDGISCKCDQHLSVKPIDCQYIRGRNVYFYKGSAIVKDL